METQNRKLFEYVIELGLGIHLKAKSETIGYASVYCYKVMRNALPAELCPYTLATSCYLLAGKVTNDEKISIRDVMNISHRVLHPEKPPLDIDELSYSIREGLVEMELMVLRLLQFKLTFEHPHNHLITMLSILRDWLPLAFEAHQSIDQVASMILQDLYVHPQLVVDHRAKTISMLVISLTFAAMRTGISDDMWMHAFQPTIDTSRFHKLKLNVLRNVYQTD